MITYPISMPPGPGFKKITWTPRSAVAEQESEFSFHKKTYEWDGQSRSFSAELPIMTLEQARAWQAWAYKLNGIAGSFYFRDDAMQSFGAASDPDIFIGFAPKVAGGGQIGPDLNTEDWPLGYTDILKAGDWISIGDRLHTVLEDVTPDSSGNATLTIWPYARGQLADNTLIKVGPEARGIFKLTQFPEFALDVEKMMNGFVITAKEDL